MALLSRKVDYALLILSYLHHHPQGGCARKISEGFGLKKAFAANVLKLLCRIGLVRGQRGFRGGYTLAKPAGEIHLGALLDLMGEPFRLADCAEEEEKACSLYDVCSVRGTISELDRRIREMLQTVTLADLVRTGENDPDCTRFHLDMVGDCLSRAKAAVATELG